MDDWAAIDAAAKTVWGRLREDEKSPELAEQLQASTASAGAQHYFHEPYSMLSLPLFEQLDLLPMPRAIVAEYESLESTSFMGLFPEIARAWITIDSRLFLWAYESGDHFEVYEGLVGSGQTIASVGLAPARPGVFAAAHAVTHVLVVATAVEVIVLAVSRKPSGRLKLSTTPFVTPSDNVTMVKIVGTETGKVYMAGQDGALYELYYTPNEGLFSYIGLPGVLSKCRKINRSAYFWGASLVPASVRGAFGGGGALKDIAADDARHILYTLNAANVIEAYDLGADGDSGALRRVALSVSVYAAARQWCAKHHQQWVPPSSTFAPGRENEFSLVSIHVVPPTQSKSIHVVAVSTTGFRFYFSTNRDVLAPAHASHGAAKAAKTGEAALRVSTAPRPSVLELKSVRAPPSPDAWASCRHAADASDAGAAHHHHPAAPAAAAAAAAAAKPQPPLGFKPEYVRGTSFKSVHRALFANGVLVLADGAADAPDALLCVAPDLLARQPPNEFNGAEERPAMREALTELSRPRGGAAAGKTAFRGKVWALAAAPAVTPSADPNLLHAHVLALASRTPAEHEMPQAALGAAAAAAKPGAAAPPPPPRASGVRCELVPAAAAAAAGPGGIRPAMVDSVAPLPEHASQLLVPRTKLLALTNAGLHRFLHRRPIEQVVALLEKFDDAPQACDLARRYGHNQACSMLLAIHCGVTGASPRVREAALHVAFMAPFTEARQSPAPYGFSATEGTFVFSANHNGLQLLVARLLRPVWNTVLFREASAGPVWPTVGTKRSATGAAAPGAAKAKAAKAGSGGGGGGGGKPLKLTAALTAEVLAAVKQPLLALQHLMQSHDPVYKHAVSRNLLADQAGAAGAAPAAAGRDGQMLLRMYQFARQPDLKSSSARAKELQSLHLVYRLLSRSVHALSMLEVLLEAHSDRRLPVDFAALLNVRFFELVTTRSAHDAVKRVLGALVTTGPLLSEPLAEELSARLAAACPSYFSAGDVLHFEARKALDRVAKAPVGSAARAKAGDEACAQLERAAAFWRRPADVLAAADGALPRACAALEALGRPVGVVRLCLVCAASFGAAPLEPPLVALAAAGQSHQSRHQGPLSPSRGEMALVSNQVWTDPAWQEALYHGAGGGGADGGAALTADERLAARRACYQLTLGTLGRLLRPEARAGAGAAVPAVSGDGSRQLADAMLVEALQSREAEFHHALYDLLYAHDRERLVRVSGSPFVEDYLRGRDRELLYKHYVGHRHYRNAAALEEEVARAPPGAYPLQRRVQALTRAVDAARSLAASGDAAGGGGGFASEKLGSLHEDLDVATLQQRVLQRLRAAGGRDQASLDRLDASLLSVSEIYNDYTSKLEYWDLCLSILHSCKHDDRGLVERLWLSIVWRAVPARARDERLQGWLDEKRAARAVMAPTVAQSAAWFEDAGWATALQTTVASLGSDLVASSAAAPSTAIPTQLLCDELEAVAHKLDESGGGGGGGGSTYWPLDALAGTGVGSDALFAAYLASLRCADRRPDVQLRLLDSVAELVARWLPRSPPENTAFAQTCRAVNMEAHISDFLTMCSATHLGDGRQGEKKIQVIAKLRELERAVRAVVSI